ncbi:MAG TPA: ATP-binding SpoIIE family protein phosphatase [Gemmatimonadaceae bacterium]|nr:ATP-binding SpoIIE family protein phosphatase [Gemmatimonadaceae bacterium]
MEEVAAAQAPAVNASQRIEVEEQTQIGAARRSAVALAHLHGLDSDAIGRLSLVVTEAATNLVRHAGRGVVILRAIAAPGMSRAVEVLALDKGPGIGDVPRAMRDGFSSIGTAGQGLGAIQRLADVFAMHAPRGQGTALMARVNSGPRMASAQRPRALEERLGVICTPIRGEVTSGDAWKLVATRNRQYLLLVDGLGHGPGAAAAAALAIDAFVPHDDSPPDRSLVLLDQATRGSRGAAASLVCIDDTEHQLRFCGVGNVDGRIHVGPDATAHLLPQNGIVGHAMPTPRITHAEWTPTSRLVMHSDGVSSRWRLDAYPGLATAHPSLVAGIIYRDFGRERDDASVIVFDAPGVAA